MSKRHEELEDRLIQFGVAVCKKVRAMPRDRVSDHFAGQLLRSSTSPAAHYSEARDAESRVDFIHKMKLGLKELRESLVWLKFQAGLSHDNETPELRDECHELIAIFVASVKTARSRR